MKRSAQQLLADALHRDVRTIERWQRQAGFPAVATVENVQAWLDSKKPASTNGTLAELKAAKIQQELDIGELKMAKLRREQMSIADVDAVSRTIGQKLSLLIRQKVEVEAPGRCVGKSIAELNAELAALGDEMREIINGNLADYAAINADD